MIEISDWLVSNFDLPSIPEKPALEFVSSSKLEELRHQNRTHLQAGANAGRHEERGGKSSASGVAGLYDHSRRTILLGEKWTGSTPAEQSILVHEMVHHVQNMAGLKFECPMAREKLAYQAQDRWLRRFGTDLETEFEVDAFTLMVVSACI